MNHQQHPFRGAHLTHTDEPQSFSNQLNHHGMHEAFAPESHWIAQLPNQAHSFVPPQYPAYLPTPLHAVDTIALSQAYENVRRNNELVQSLRRDPVLTQQTEIIPSLATQAAFGFELLRHDVSAAPGEAAHALEEDMQRQFPISPEHLFQQVAPILTPPISNPNESPPYVHHSLSNAPKSPSPSGDINLCHDCDRFLRSFAYYRHTTIHLGSGECINCEQRERSPTLPPRLLQDTQPLPSLRRENTPRVARAASARGGYYCTHPYYNRGPRNGKPFTRKDNLNVHVKNVHKESSRRARSQSEGGEGGDDEEEGRV